VQGGLPGYDGIMTDSDFLNGEGTKTHFSQSDGYSEGLIILDARLGWNFDVGAEETFTAKLFPYIEFQYLHFKWSARDGYLQYPPETAPPYTPWSASEPKVPVYGTGIIYQQDYYIPAVGFMGTIPLSKSVSVTASLSFSPYLWCNDVDNHVLRLIDFYTNMQGGFMLEPRASLTVKLTPRIGFTVDALYRYIAQLTGDIYTIQQGVAGIPDPSTGILPGTQSATTSKGGASLEAGSITLSLDVAL
jgi:outer membrane protease